MIQTDLNGEEMEKQAAPFDVRQVLGWIRRRMRPSNTIGRTITTRIAIPKRQRIRQYLASIKPPTTRTPKVGQEKTAAPSWLTKGLRHLTNTKFTKPGMGLWAAGGAGLGGLRHMMSDDPESSFMGNVLGGAGMGLAGGAGMVGGRRLAQRIMNRSVDPAFKDIAGQMMKQTAKQFGTPDRVPPHVAEQLKRIAGQLNRGYKGVRGTLHGGLGFGAAAASPLILSSLYSGLAGGGEPEPAPETDTWGWEF